MTSTSLPPASHLYPPWTSLPSPVNLSVSHHRTSPSPSHPLPTDKSTPSPPRGATSPSSTPPAAADLPPSFSQSPRRSSSFADMQAPPASPTVTPNSVASGVPKASNHNRSASDGVVSLSSSLLQQRRSPHHHSDDPALHQYSVPDTQGASQANGSSFMAAAYGVPLAPVALSRASSSSARSRSDASGSGSGSARGAASDEPGHANGRLPVHANGGLPGGGGSHMVDSEDEEGALGFQSPEEDLGSPRRVPDPAAPPGTTAPRLPRHPLTALPARPPTTASVASSSPLLPLSPDSVITASTGFSPLPRTFSSSSLQNLAQVSKLMTLLDDERRLAVEAQAHCMRLQQQLHAFQRLRKAEGRRALVEGARFMLILTHPTPSPRHAPPASNPSANGTANYTVAASGGSGTSGSSSKHHAKVFSVCYEATNQMLLATEVGKDKSSSSSSSAPEGSGVATSSADHVTHMLAMSAVMHVEPSSRLFPQQAGGGGGTWTGGLKGLFRRSGKGSVEAVTDSRCFSLQARDGTVWHLQLPVGGNGRSRDEWVGAVRDAVEEAGGGWDAERTNGHW